ncbi:NAD(P)-dependent oxidoreductase [Geodermatophilus sp. Leaf369]|uniref:SDR family oxidoreductase n=1 Tax=Geodermatophilus sp. Leaf369 TaxID=1736354 RepID=UPI0006FF6529|nr:SDR family oxidoreductase [Geodermatophilus sp. Leaf369]KQS60381.1 NAD(P)-dependent oxidoreductase [Geodermatophilus sp. Leaf369]
MTLIDPRTKHPTSTAIPGLQIEHPGGTAELTPAPDHGEESYRGSGRLAGRRALITGADSGIGRAVAIAYAREGADVAISYLSEDADAEETARLVREAGRTALLLPGDISDETVAKGLVAQTVEGLGGLDLLVHNAAFQNVVTDVLEFSTAEIDRTFRTNVYAFFWLLQAAKPELAPGSSVIVTSSVQAFTPSPNLAAYAATKAALVNMTTSMAEEFAQVGVRVNCVAPGPVWTPLIPATMPEDMVEGFGEQSQLKRAAQPAELAGAYVYLASEDASFTSGEVIGVTGGSPIN